MRQAPPEGRITEKQDRGERLKKGPRGPNSQSLVRLSQARVAIGEGVQATYQAAVPAPTP